MAQAHWPTIKADIVCDVETGTLTVNYTSTAWPGEGSDPTNDPSRANPQINITLDTAFVTSGAYTAPNYSFSGSFPLTGKQAGDVVEIAAVAVGTWGNGEPGGNVRDWVDLTVPECGKTEDGRFTGGGSQLRVGDVRVTRGLTIHCDLLLSNNLEVNWGGNRFHMTEHLADGRVLGRPQHHPGPARRAARHADRRRHGPVQQQQRLHDRVHAPGLR